MAETPTPAAVVLIDDGKFSVRGYENLTLVRAPMKDSSDDGSFRRLFGYITGKNSRSENIPMTAPVLMDERETGRGMSFIMPSAMDPRSLPDPLDPVLERVSFSGGRFAVYRFSGGRNASNETKARIALEQWMAGRGLVAADKPLYGYYNPPWIPTWFRRNEVWIRLATD